MSLKKIFISLFVFVMWTMSVLHSQDDDIFFIKSIHTEALRTDSTYALLKELCIKYPGRIAGSEAYLTSAQFMEEKLSALPGVESYLQDCWANYWKRGDEEMVKVTHQNGKSYELNTLSLGNSIATPIDGLEGDILEFHSLQEVEALDEGALTGKIVFFNRPMNKDIVNTFHAYGRAVDQRSAGPSVAASKGAIAVLVRSVTTLLHDLPHTGVLGYKDSTLMIPAMAISTNDANRLSQWLKDGRMKAMVKNNCKMLGPKQAPNVIGEIKGSLYPDKVIVVGGHLDSWDINQGAHDDGSGCVQSFEVLRILMALGYQPRHTIRCVLFSNEENGVAGGNTYARKALEDNELHVAALESDAGGFSPRGFSFDAMPEVFNAYYRKVSEWLPLLEPYGYQFEKGYSGVDISPLKPQNPLLIGLMPDSQRYFDFHHNANDRVENVHPRELALGAAAMTSLIYLIDKYGLN